MTNKIFILGMSILGACIIISAVILANALGTLQLNGNLTGNLNGNLSGSLTTTSGTSNNSDVLQAYDAAVMLGYDDQGRLISDLKSKVLKDLPYTFVGDHYLFSKKEIEAWIAHRMTVEN